LAGVGRVSAAPEAISRPINRLLKLAVVGGVEAAVKLHIDRGDDLNARDDRGRTPLMLAAAANRARICRVLIEARADVLARDASGNDALSIARAVGAADAAAEIESALTILGHRAATAEPQIEPDSLTPLTDCASSDEPTQGIEASNRVDQPPIPPPTLIEPENAGDGAGSGFADDGEPMAATLAGATHFAEQAFAIDGTTALIDLSNWEAEVQSAPPVGDASLAAAPAAVHRAISLHEPVDDSVDWSDFEAFLPEHATPFPSSDSVETASELRALLLRVLREGSVPSIAVDDLDGVSREFADDSPMSPLRYVIGDLGAETDERIEYRAPHESFEVHVDPGESADEEQAVDEALAFLDDLESHRNDPMRLYMREAQRRSLIGADEEVALAQIMENASREAVDALAEWPLGIARVLEAVEAARIGERLVTSIVAGQREEIDATPLAADEGSDVTLTATDSETSPELDGGDEADGLDELADATLFDKIASLQALVNSAAAGNVAQAQIRAALHALSLSRSFLLQLSDSALGDDAEAAPRFLAATRRVAAARDRMAGANLRLVLSIAKRYLFSGIPMDDLIQEGNIGLLKAVDKFDWRRGFKFSTMATWWIRQQVSRSVADSAFAIRLPAHFRDDVLLLERETKDMEKSLGRAPTTEQLAARLGMRSGKVEMLIRAVSTPMSLDELEAELESIGAVAPDPFDALDAEQLGEALAASLDALDSKQAKVVRLRFGIGGTEPCTLEQVGQLFDVTRERIRQIEVQAMKRLMHPTRLDKLRPWLGEDSPGEAAKPARAHNANAPGASFGEVRDVAEPKRNHGTVPDETNGPQTAEIDGRCDPDALERVLARASELGIVVECTGDGISRATWVNVDEPRDNQTRGLVRRLLAMGFMHWPGKGYWK
jgi:RNA polymerase primary sigma factor